MPAFALKQLLLVDGSGGGQFDFVHSLYCDSQPACRNLAANVHSPDVILNDVKLWRQASDVDELDFFWHSPCCYDFSSNGKGQGTTSERGLLVKYSLKYVVAKKRKIVGFEQTRCILFKKHKHVVRRMKNVLKKAGYYVKSGVINSKNHGSPQRRLRFFMIGIRRDQKKNKFVWPAAAGNVRFDLEKRGLSDAMSSSDEPMKLPPKGQMLSKEPNRERNHVRRAIRLVKRQCKHQCKKKLASVKQRLQEKGLSTMSRVVKKTIVKTYRDQCGRHL